LSGIERVRKAAKERKAEKFTTLLHHIDTALLHQTYHWLQRDAAPGVDGMTWDAYGEGLEARLRDLEDRIHAASDRAGRGDGKPETFDFRGLTHICARSRRGQFQLARHTRRDRKMAKLLEISGDLRRRWHQDIAEQGKWLGSVVRGFFAYHAVPTSHRALSAFRHHVIELWRRALRRRSQKDRTSWTDMDKLADRWLPKPRICHPWPSQRFRVKHPRWEPYA
jgi:hypothetical protein